jgi:hypothetical protein
MVIDRAYRENIDYFNARYSTTKGGEVSEADSF